MLVFWILVIMWYICGLVGAGIELYSNWYQRKRHVTVSSALTLLAISVMGLWGLYLITNEYKEIVWNSAKDIIIFRNLRNKGGK